MAVDMSRRTLPPLPGLPAPPPPDERPVTVDFLLPTGLVVSMECSRTASLMALKEQLYNTAKDYPLFSLLKDQGFYNFMGECCASVPG